MLKHLVVFCLLSCVGVCAYSQPPDEKYLWNNLISIDNNNNYSSAEKLQEFYNLKAIADKENVHHDSVYARLLLIIAYYEANDNRNFNLAIDFTNRALKINLNDKGGSKYYATKSYFFLAGFYNKLTLFGKALNYYDSAIAFAKTFPDTTYIILYSRLDKAYLFFLMGDYQKAVEESIQGTNYALQKRDSSYFLSLENQKAQSLFYENNIDDALTSVDSIIVNAQKRNETFELASALKTKALILQTKGEFIAADSLFKASINFRTRTTDSQQIATDYNDYGNFCLNSLHNYDKAGSCYRGTIFYGEKLKDSVVLARANINIAALYLLRSNYSLSSNYCLRAMKYLNLFKGSIDNDPSSEQLSSIEAKELVVVLMTNKIEILKGLYLTTKNKKHLAACLHASLVMDTLITKMRHMQSGTESKLYWRNHTRNFYANAIEASYLGNDSRMAFYFMEKSRNVLLNDKLNELNASSYLSKEDAARQEDYEIRIIEFEQKLSKLSSATSDYVNLQIQLLNAKSEFEQFILSLEQKYPAYYQYKYADDVPDLKDFQSYLANNHQSFVDYFTGDSVTYILAITSSATKFIRLSQKDFNKQQLSDFLELCADKEALNNHYNSFAQLSNSIYKKIFEPLHLSKGRVIICLDNTVIPFEALCADTKGKDFLLHDYSFNYVYSARFLMKQFKSPIAQGDFAGFAPVSFSELNASRLMFADDALYASAAYYKNNKLFTNKKASRNNFFTYAPLYAVVAVFSHASADTTEAEPMLFMQDSLIYLSELQQLNNPATKLVLLSACETNVGKAATGEGIYSLARGFTTAGIPSVAATLWKADEEAIYAISEKFNQYLSEGMNKDEALQKAKLYFIKNNSNEKLLPYYWSNMIIIGNADAIKLTGISTGKNSSLVIITIILGLMACVLIYAGRKFYLKKKSKQYTRS
jgi:CHAT domain-containing protein